MFYAHHDTQGTIFYIGKGQVDVLGRKSVTLFGTGT